MPRALVTGGTGFAGRHLTARLLELGYDVVASGLRANAPSAGNEVMSLDVRDGDAVARVVSDVLPDEVYHLAGLSRPTAHHSRDYYDVHLQGTLNVLHAVRAAGLADTARTLVVGSAYAYGAWKETITERTPLEPVNHYGASKAAADLAARAEASDGLYVVRARPFNHIGPGQASTFVVPSIVAQVHQMAMGLQEPILRVGRIDPTRDFLDVRDVVDAYWRLLQDGRPGEAYNVASGNGVTIGVLVEHIREMSGVPFELRSEPARVRENDIVTLVGDPAKLRGATGWSPRRSLEDSLDELLQDAGH